MKAFYTAPLWMALAAIPAASIAAVVGHLTPAKEVTEARIASLPAAQQAPWRAYLERSRKLMAADQAALAAERAAGSAPEGPFDGRGTGSGMPLNRGAAWYASPEARHVADNIVSFQTPAGGWGKNVNRTGPVRQRGQSYVLVEGKWAYVGTIDNDATTTELRFLARVQAQAPGEAGKVYRDAFLKGVRYLLNSQYPNGGFPQVYPLEGDYHDAITFNDDALIQAVEVLDSVAARQGDYGFVPADVAYEAREAAAKALRLILTTQVKVDGVHTGWGQQHDALTLEPTAARNFEPAALTSNETAPVLVYLMGLPNPSPEVVAAVHAGAAWLKRVAVRDVEWTGKSKDVGRQAVAKPGAGPIWSRLYDIASMKPIFGDRDRTIHDDVNEISLERRNGYSWYGTGPAKALEQYETWSRAHPQQASARP
ncbi:pectate lyase [Massilia horti]|uniref:Pectate lyase n=1 Tax=Massilia horti TaxID=2562153 RepID=A0A4Y9SX77_9BURK|nr:pectate lyase [Massilia horti]TFW31022.1 pectate lyase [Massilia horti]